MASGDLMVDIPADHVRLAGVLVLPEQAHGCVLFAHGSGSSRFSPRNRLVAERLQRRGFGTLLLDLLTRDEERVDAMTRQLRFDIQLLASRLIAATDWVTHAPMVPFSRVGYFGASTGAAAALIAAARRSSVVSAVVSRGGRPDLAATALDQVHAPTLLIVGGEDREVLLLNRAALQGLGAPRKELRVVPGATHLFEEPGALDEVARLATDWFTQAMGGQPDDAARRLTEP
jgi:putative phosphoribosyl transferase